VNQRHDASGARVAHGAASGARVAHGAASGACVAQGAASGARVAQGAASGARVAQGAASGARVERTAQLGSFVVLYRWSSPSRVESHITGGSEERHSVSTSHREVSRPVLSPGSAHTYAWR
jgi:hypothetical protein